jgi:hypothetical protein
MSLPLPDTWMRRAVALCVLSLGMAISELKYTGRTRSLRASLRRLVDHRTTALIVTDEETHSQDD